MRAKKCKYSSLFYKLKDCRGFILIDCIVGIVILSVALLAMAQTYKMAVKQVAMTNDDTYAYYIAKQAVEGLKSIDRLPPTGTTVLTTAYGTVGNNFATRLQTLQNNTTPTINNNITYTTTFTAKTSYETLSNNIQPVEVKVSWTSATPPQQQRSITILTYCYDQPLPPSATFTEFPPPPATPFAHSLDESVQYYLSKGKFNNLYTPVSTKYQLWADYFGNQYNNITLTQGANTYNNQAATEAWDIYGTHGPGIPIAFNNIPSSKFSTTDILTLQFEAINDPNISPNFTSIALPTNYNSLYGGFQFNIVIDGQTIVSKVVILASDTAFNKITPALNTGSFISGVTITSDGIQIDVSKLPTAIKNTIQNASTHTLSIGYLNDAGITPGTGIQGYDSSPTIANISFKKTSQK